MTYKSFKICIKQKNKTKGTFAERIKHIPSNRLLAIDEMGFGHGFIHPRNKWQAKGHNVKNYQVRHRFESRSKSIICLTSTKYIVNYEWSFQPYNTITFVDFLRTSLIGYTGFYLILNNVSFHRGRQVSKVLNEIGVTPIFIDRYTPEQNPIEEVFANMKSIIRSYCPTNISSFTKTLYTAVKRQHQDSLVKYFNRSIRFQHI